MECCDRATDSAESASANEALASKRKLYEEYMTAGKLKLDIEDRHRKALAALSVQALDYVSASNSQAIDACIASLQDMCKDIEKCFETIPDIETKRKRFLKALNESGGKTKNKLKAWKTSLDQSQSKLEKLLKGAVAAQECPQVAGEVLAEAKRLETTCESLVCLYAMAAF